jgi:hypothetical protein
MDSKLKKKSFCKWGKENIKKNMADVIDLTAQPKYVCQKCARVARRKANVCDPFQVTRKTKKAG